MRKKQNLIGKRFGKLVVIEEIKERDKQGKIHYLCQCDCGNVKDVKAINLTKGKTKSCGCSQYESTIKDEDFIGKTFGKFTVLSPVENSSIKKYRCKCECGNIVEVNAYNLRDGYSTNCGCVRNTKLRNLNKLDLIGKKFGRLTVLKEVGTNSYTKLCYLCQCDCGNTCIVATQSLTSGHTQSCGCINSHGNEEIAKILTKMNIPFKREYQLSIKSKYISYMRLDFYLPNINVAIEYDGEQHYKSIPFYGGDEGLKLQQLIDLDKDNECIRRNIKLIRIAYTEFNNLETILMDLLSPTTTERIGTNEDR